MLLPDFTIERYANDTRAYPLIEPFNPDQLQPASYDLRLGRQFCFPGANNVSFATKTYTLPPGKFVLGCTQERINLPPNLAGEVSGKSGVARRGIQIEAAGHVDPGYSGVITLEIVNFGDAPVFLSEGMGIAKIVFHKLADPCRTPYSAERNTHQFSHGPKP